MNDENDKKLTSRRQFMRNAGALALASTSLNSLASTDTSEGMTFADGPRPLVRYPGKRELILVHTRPPHLETPAEVFNESIITPNNAFFVRYHLANFPTSFDPQTYKLTVKGAVKTPLSLTLAELKSSFQQAEVVAVNQCAGNSRGYSSPRVFGAQLGNGAMGNARWLGVSLKAVLEKAGIQSNAQQVIFNGMDKPVLPSTPDFRKALDIEHALSPEPMLAWSMNGQDLPFLNGYPLKLIVPGYFGTYWVKHLTEIEVIDHPYTGHNSYFMNKGYRLPDNDCMCVTPGTKADKTRPISTLPVRSFITSAKANEVFTVNSTVRLKGIAFDDGSGIKAVDVSIDGGQTWRCATLDESLGRFSFRGWQLDVKFTHKGPAILMVRASNKQGEIQPLQATWNPGGYRRNVIESTPITIV